MGWYRMKGFSPWVTLALGVMSSLSFAGEFDELPVVLSASRLRQPLTEAPSAVTIIDRDMIEASGVRHIADLMRFVPGAVVGYNDGNHPVVAMHGMSATYASGVQVLLDGVSVYSPLWGGMQWEELPLALADIDRIEVVRGPNAAVFGPNSYAGVINIITRHPALEQGWSVSANAGEGGIADFAVSHSAGFENDHKYRATFGQRASQGFDSRPDSQYQLFGNIRSEQQVDASNAVEMTLRAAENKKDNGDYTAIGSSRVPHPAETGLFHFQTRWTHASSADDEWWIQFYHQQSKTRDQVTVDYRQSRFWSGLNALFGGALGGVVPNPLRYNVDSGFETERDGIEFQQTRRWSSTLRTVWGVESRHDAAVSPTFLAGDEKQSANLLRAYGNVEWRFAPAWTLNLANMIEKNTLASTAWSPKAALTWQPVSGHVFRVGISSALRTPSIYEAKANAGYAIPVVISSRMPPPLLAALRAFGMTDPSRFTLMQSSGKADNETVQAEEVGYSFEIPEWRVSGEMRWVWEHHHGLMTEVSRVGLLAPADFVNADRVEVEGGDLTLRWKPNDDTSWRLALSRTAIRSPTAPSQYNGSAPETTVSFLWDQRIDQNWRASMNYQRVGAMSWTDSGGGSNHPALAPIEYLNLRLARRINVSGFSQGELALVTQNALGNHREYFAGLSANGTPETVAARRSFLQFSGQF